MTAPFELEVEEPQPRPRRARTERQAAARGAVGPRITERVARPRAPFDQEAAYARCREEAEAGRRRYYTCMGVDPDAPDRDVLRAAEVLRRQQLVAEGWTWVGGELRRWEP